MSLLDPVLGPMLIGSYASVLAFGIMIVQSYLYFLWYKCDRIRIKLVVAFLLILDAVTIGFSIAGLYIYFVSNYGNPGGLAKVDIGFSAYPALAGITSLVVQCFFGWRIQTLTGSYALSVCIYFASTSQFLISVGASAADKVVNQLTKEVQLKAMSLAWLSVSLFTDLIITVTLVTWLHRSRTGFDNTDDLITRSIRMAVQTGLLTTSFATAVLVSFIVSPNTTIYIAFGLPLPMVYSNSLLSTLNVRRGWMPSGGSSFDDKLSMAKDDRSRTCHVCDHDGRTALSGLTLTPPRSKRIQSATIISMHDMTDVETQNSDADSFAHNKVKVLVESSTEHASD